MKPGKELTMLDMVQALIFVSAGLITVMFWMQVDTLPHSGWLMIFGSALTFFGCIRYIIKFFRQPIKPSEQQDLEFCCKTDRWRIVAA